MYSSFLVSTQSAPSFSTFQPIPDEDSSLSIESKTTLLYERRGNSTLQTYKFLTKQEATRLPVSRTTAERPFKPSQRPYLILQTFKKAGFRPSLSSYSFSGVSINESRKSDSLIV